jgi:BirA family biotin operon repressor/biotin-[acetyl-CoA-carboxylase] ligase
MPSGTMHWPAEAIWEAVAPLLPGFTVELLPSIDSTNDELMRRAQAGDTAPCLLVAQRQTAGRGRMGRVWHSEARQGPANLTFSLGLALAPKDWSGLSLAVGLSLAHSLHPDILLKWPNDLWWRDRKLAGVLIETANFGKVGSSRFVVIGIGLNIHTPEGAGMATAPAGLRELLPGVDASQALGRIALPLVQAIAQFEVQGFAPFQAAFNARDALARQPVNLSDGRQGVADGVDASGALLLQSAQGVQRVISAEVSVRPVHAPGADIFQA